MLTYSERVARALDIFVEGLMPYFEREMQAVYHEDWSAAANRTQRTTLRSSDEIPTWDAQFLLTAMWEQWNYVFRAKLGVFERSVVSELREFRNRWAHQAPLTENDVFRVQDSVRRLLVATGANNLVPVIDTEIEDFLRERMAQLISNDAAQSRLNERRIIDVGLFTICGLAIILTVLGFLAPRHFIAAWLFAGFVACAFLYLIVQRMRTDIPLHTVHECHRCRRVIYTAVCPYCNPKMAQLKTPKLKSETATRVVASYQDGGGDQRIAEPRKVSAAR